MPEVIFIIGNPKTPAWFRQTEIHQTLNLKGEYTKYTPKL